MIFRIIALHADRIQDLQTGGVSGRIRLQLLLHPEKLGTVYVMDQENSADRQTFIKQR